MKELIRLIPISCPITKNMMSLMVM